MRPKRSAPMTTRSPIDTRARQVAVRAPRGRRRRTAIAVPRGSRHRGQAPRARPGRADLQHRPFAAASKHLDRVSHAARPVRIRAPARRPLQRGLGRRPQGSRTADRAERRGAVEAAERQSHSILGRVAVEPGGTVSARRSSSPGNSPRLVSRWSAKPRMCCRRSARRASIWDCAMPPISPRSCATRCCLARIPARLRCSSATIRRGAATSQAAPSRSTWRTVHCSAISCRCSRCARPACI